MIKDRGSKKWTAIMLPEHVANVKHFIDEQSKVVKPVLDEQAWQGIELTVQEALENEYLLVFVYWSRGHFKNLVGTIQLIDVNKKEIRIVDKFGERFYLPVDALVDVRVYSD